MLLLLQFKEKWRVLYEIAKSFGCRAKKINYVQKASDLRLLLRAQQILNVLNDTEADPRYRQIQASARTQRIPRDLRTETSYEEK